VAFQLSGSAQYQVDYGLSSEVSCDSSSGVYRVTIPPNTTSVAIPVVPFDDTVVEGSETAQVTLSADTGYSIDPEHSSAAVTIADNDMPTVSILATDPSAAEAGPDPGEFTISRTGSTAQALTVYYTIAGSATNGDGRGL